MNPVKNLSTHAGRLERWLGKEKVEMFSASMKDWYGPPIPIAGVPGNVWAHKGGDFRGVIGSGQFTNLVDFSVMRLKRAWRDATKRAILQQNAGFASLSDMISEVTAGKRREFAFFKQIGAGTGFAFSSCWRVGAQPPVGSAPAAAGAGTAFDDSSTGGFPFTNPTSGDTQHFVTGYGFSNLALSNLLLYDLLFGVAKTMASTGTEAVTGVPTRYQSQTSTDQDYIGGNFLFIQVGGTALANTAHNWTVCLYKDQGGNSSTLPSSTGVAANVVDRLDTATAQQWFCPLETGDVGIKALTQMQCSASVATGVIWFMIGHPIAWFTMPVALTQTVMDGVSTAFNLARIFDDACLAFLSCSSSSSAQNYNGQFITVAG